MSSVDCSRSACFSESMSCSHASPGSEFQDTGFGVSLTLNAKFAGVGILTEWFGEEREKECFEREVFESMKAVSCLKGYIPTYSPHKQGSMATAL